MIKITIGGEITCPYCRRRSQVGSLRCNSFNLKLDVDISIRFITRKDLRKKEIGFGHISSISMLVCWYFNLERDNFLHHLILLFSALCIFCVLFLLDDAGTD